MDPVIIRNISFFLFLLLSSGLAWSLNWTIHPALNVDEIYSDNIRLASTDQKAAFVTDVSPGISINGRSSISTFDLNYRMQNLYNAQGDSGLDINNQLQMNTLYELVKNRLFIDSSSSISQQNVSNRRIVSDNISGGDSSTTVSTFRLSPYWTPHFQSFANGEFRVGYDRVDSKGGNSSLSKTDSFSQNFRLTSGRDFSYFSWSLTFNNSNRRNSNSEDVNFQDSTAEIRRAIGRKFSLFARAGQSSNSFASNSNSSNNGISYTVGGQWQPSQRFRLEAGYGNNRFVTVEILPFNRLHWITTYTNNDIGLNTGGTWNTALDYNTRRSVWSLRYAEDTVTTQQLLLEQQIFTVIDVFGDQKDDVLNQTPLFNIQLPTLTDEVFITKTTNLSVSFRTGKSDISADVFKVFRTFELSGIEEEVTGISGSWNWKVFRRSSFTLRSSWQKTESNGSNAFSDKRFDISASITRNILSRLNGSVVYRYVDQSSGNDLNSYSENRITASLSLYF